MDTQVEVPLGVIRALVARARLAPSTHNTQPWRWTVLRDGDRPTATQLELSRVDERSLPEGDPGGRELVMSCGAALMTLRVAAAEALLDTRVELLPDPGRPELLARVRFATGAVDCAFSELDAAVPVRHTWRRPFSRRGVPPERLDRLASEAGAEGAQLRVLSAQERPIVAALVRECDQAYFSDSRRRAELARWMRPRRRGDGMPSPAVRRLPARMGIGRSSLGRRVGDYDSGLLMAAPEAVVLWTDHDDPASWLAAGQALQRVLLVAADDGLAAGFANRPCQDQLRRAAIRGLLEIDGHPQVIMRLGYPGTPARPVPRLPVDEVLDLGGPEPEGYPDGWTAADPAGTSGDELG